MQGFSLEQGICLYGIPKDKYTCDGGKVGKKIRIGKKIPLLSTNRKTAFIYRWN